MVRFLYDSFTAANGTAITSRSGETGASWTRHPNHQGQWTIQNNRAYASTTGLVYASGIPYSAEYDVEGDCYIASTSSSAGIAGRVQTDANTCYYCYWLSNLWNQIRNVNGTLTNIGSWSSSVSTGTTYHVRLEIRDSHKKLFINGVERLSHGDNTITGPGRAGFRAGSTGSSSAGKHWDYIEANDLFVPKNRHQAFIIN